MTQFRTQFSPVGLGGEVAWLCPTLNKNGGAKPLDLSGHGNHGTYFGGMATVADTGSGGLRAYEFDGVDDYVEVANSPSLYQYPLTISFWNYRPGPYPVNTGGEGYYVLADGTLTGIAVVANQETNSGQKYTYAYNGSNYAAFNINTMAGVPKNWEHFTLTIDENGTEWFENGVSGGTTTWTGTPTQPSNTSALKIGANRALSNFLDGRMDDIRVYGRVLTATEITHLATARGIQGNGKTRLKARYNEPAGVLFAASPPEAGTPKTRTLLGVGL